MPRSLGEGARLRLDLLGGEDAADGCQQRVAVHQLEVAGELLNAVDVAAAFDLDGDGCTIAGPFTRMSTGPIAVMYSRRTRVCPSPSSLDLLGQQAAAGGPRRRPSAGPGSMPSSWLESWMISWIEITQDVGRLRVRHPPSSAPADARSSSTSSRVNGGRAHPVERLVAERVGVHEHRAVGFHHQQPGGRAAGGPTGVRRSRQSTGPHETHPSSLCRVRDAGDALNWARACTQAGRRRTADRSRFRAVST